MFKIVFENFNSVDPPRKWGKVPDLKLEDVPFSIVPDSTQEYSDKFVKAIDEF